MGEVVHKYGRMGALNAKKAREKNAILSRRAKVAEMMLAGETSPPKIAAALKVCERTAKNDIYWNRAEWQKTILEIGDSLAIQEYHFLMMMRDKALKKFEETGEVEFWDAAIRTSDKIRKLFGIDKTPTEEHTHYHDHKNLTLNVTAAPDERRMRLSAIASRLGIGSGGPVVDGSVGSASGDSQATDESPPAEGTGGIELA